MAKKGKNRRKSRSAAQKAASKRNVKKAQAARRKNKPRSTSKKRKVKKQNKSSKRPVAKRPTKKSFIDKIPILKNPTVQRIGFGLGMGVIVVNIIDLVARFAPAQFAAPLVANKGIIKLGVEAVTEPLSAAVDIATGGLPQLNISGRGQSQQTINGNGFA